MSMSTLTYEDIDHFILFGGGLTLISLAQTLSARGYAVDIYTAPRHAAEPLDEQGRTLAQRLEQHQLTYTVTEDINTEPTLLPRVSPTSMGLGFGEAWSFDAHILEAFSGHRLLDFMGIPLPRYRGGAHYTWMIQRQDRQGGFHIQVINEEMVQGEFDSGELVYSQPYTFPQGAVTPMDYFNAAQSAEKAFILDFIDKVLAGYSFTLAYPDESASLFLPRLNTQLNGWMDWGWSGEALCQFIRSFDDPYPGAKTEWHTQGTSRVVHLKGARLDQTEAPFHPFQSGLVTRINADGAIVIATTSGALTVERIIDGEVDDTAHDGADDKSDTSRLNGRIQLGDRFHTSHAQRDAALLGRAQYRSTVAESDNCHGHGEADAEPIELEGRGVVLRRLTHQACTPRYVAWLQDPEVNQYLETRWQEQTLDSVKAFVEAMQNSDDNILLAIVEQSSGAHIGNIKLGPINRRHGHAEVSYFIGEKTCWGKGYATEAIRLVTDYAFEFCGIEYMLAGAYEHNVGSIRALEKAGYQHQGRFHKQLIGPNGREDHIFLGCSKSVNAI